MVAISVTFVVHAALYFGLNLRTAAPNVWTVIQLSIVLTAMGVVYCGRHPPSLTQEMRNEHSSPVYWWLSILFPLFLFYCVFSFFFYPILMHHGYLDFRDGQDVIVNHSRIVKILTAAELPKYQLYEARKYSAHWMVCNSLLFIVALINVKLGSGEPMEKKALMDASELYEVERRARYGERPGFRISELQISPTQSVPWHFHNHIDDTFYVVAGKIRLFIRDPHENVRLLPGDSYRVKAGRPHLVTNDGDTSATFVVLQGIGEYDYVPFSLD